jgi:hypothetical protein
MRDAFRQIQSFCLVFSERGPVETCPMAALENSGMAGVARVLRLCDSQKERQLRCRFVLAGF